MHPALGRIGRTCFALGVAGLVVFAAYTLTHFGGADVDRLFNQWVYNEWVYNGLILLAFALCALRAALVKRERTAWACLAGGLAAWAAGELFFTVAYGGEPPFPSIADAFYLAFYPACYVALFLLIRARVSSFNGSVWLDGATATLAAAALGAAVLFEVVLDSTEGSPGAVVTNLAYPLGDVLLLALVVGVGALTGWRPGRAWAVIGAGLAANVLADAVFLYQSASGTYVEGTILDALWPASVFSSQRQRGRLRTARRVSSSRAGRSS